MNFDPGDVDHKGVWEATVTEFNKMLEQKKKVAKVLDRMKSAAQYTLGTLPYPTSVTLKTNVKTNHEDWVAIHRGRAASSYRQLESVLKDIEELKKELDL